MECVVNAKARLIYPRERVLVPIVQEAGWVPRPLWMGADRGEFRPRQTRQLPRAVDLKGRLLSCQSY